MSKGIIFDLDDTLIETTKHFDSAKEKFKRIMAELEFPAEECLVTLNQFDIRNVIKHGGFMKECFPLALGETYDYYCRRFGRPYCSQTRDNIVNLGWQVFEQEVEEIKGASEVLETLAGKYPLFLSTKGDIELQSAKLEASGLAHYFQKVYITPVKTEKEYLHIAREQKLSVIDSWVIGNSMKGDINPGIRSGFNCIHVFHRHTWDYEEEPAVGEHHSVASLTEVLDIIV